MSLAQAKAHRRKQQQRRQKKRRQQKSPAHGRTVPQFRDRYGISKSAWHEQQRRGLTPDVLRPGGPRSRGVVTPEAEAAWLAQRTAQTTQTAAE